MLIMQVEPVTTLISLSQKETSHIDIHTDHTILETMHALFVWLVAFMLSNFKLIIRLQYIASVCQLTFLVYNSWNSMPTYLHEGAGLNQRLF